jgi:CheY-like chemotaxis protein
VIILHNAPTQEREIPTARHRVLLVEDCRDSAELVRACLKGSEIELTISVDGNQRLEAFKSATYNLVLMDFELPVLDGCAATLAIRHWEIQNSRAFTTISALTAVRTTAGLARIFASGGSNYLPKPITRATLLQNVRQFLRCAHRREEAEKQLAAY